MEDRSGARARNVGYLRASNQGGVIRTLLRDGGASRQELSEQLHLTKMSITYIVNDLMEQGAVREEPASGTAEVAPGRRPARLLLCPDRLYALGVYISRDRVCSAVVDIIGAVKDCLEEELPGKRTGEALLEMVVRQVRKLTGRHQGKRILGIGIACIGLVDMGRGRMLSAPGFYGIGGLDLRGRMAEFSLPVYVLNDMKAAALAELYYGAARDYTDFVYLGVTNGIGAGVVAGGKLFEGKGGFSGEIGHMCIRRDGPRCSCGASGCLELYVSIPRLVEWSGQDAWHALLAAEKAGDSECADIFNRLCSDLGAALVNIANLFDTQAVVIGHEGAGLPAWCFTRMQETLDSRAMTSNVRRVALIPSVLGEDIGRISAAAAVFYQLFRGDVSIKG